MAQQVAFIDREEHLATIDELLHEVGTRRLLCIQAGGGIGKTRLLQKIYQHYTSIDYTKTLFVTPIIDFDDQTFHIPLNIEHRIAQMLGEQNFQPYLRALWDWRKLEAAGLSDERLNVERGRMTQAFIECFNRVSDHKRVVVLFDTMEAITNSNAWDYTLQLGTCLRNVVLIFAGRNVEQFRTALSTELKNVASQMDLVPLAPAATQSYMRAKQELLNINKPRDLLEKITWLSEGKPILIDLAIEWVAKDIPLDWMSEHTLDELQSFPSDEKETLQHEFEQRLVQQVSKTQRFIDQLTLTMSHVYPLNADLIALLLGVMEDRAQSLFQEAQSYAFIKLLPDGRISLHDEVRRMIDDYVWSEVDSTGGRRRWYSERFALYLQKRVVELKAQIALLSTQQEASTELGLFMKKEVLERKIWVLEEQRLRHTLYSNLEEGIQLFSELFDKASATYREQVKGTLLSEVGQYQSQLSPKQAYIFAIRYAQYLFDLDKYIEAKDVLLEALSNELLLPLQQIEILRLLGNTEIRLDNIGEGVMRFRAALKLSAAVKDPLVRNAKQAEVRNALGWGHRLLGQVETAIEEYQAALDYALQMQGRDSLIASILNNLGYAYHLCARGDTGLSYSLRALKVVPTSNIQQLGWINSTLGEICLGLGRYNEARHYYEVALSYFKEVSNNEGQAIVHMEISHSKRHLAHMIAEEPSAEREVHLQSALKHAKTSVLICEQYNLRKDLPLCHYEVGRTLIDLRRFEEAKEHLKLSYPQNLKRAGGFALADLVALAEIAHEQHDYEELERLVEEVKDDSKAKSLQVGKRADAELFKGRLLRLYAQAQFEQGQYKAALHSYVEALKRIARHGGYGAYNLDYELEQLMDYITQLPDEIKASWCNRFIEKWTVSDVDDKRSELVINTVHLAKTISH